jgi:transglutaminase-like putative cysteine protease
LESTFLVDYEDVAVRKLISERPSSTRPSLEELMAWVRETIEPSTDRGFDAASAIVKTRRGDCTEFAVLMAALARSFGHPARVVTGLVMVGEGASIQAYGHAWTEILVGEDWELVDATPIQGGAAIAYLPLGAVRDEGPGFALDVMRIVTIGVTGVRLLSPQH